jgi:hypothetical protein
VSLGAQTIEGTLKQAYRNHIFSDRHRTLGTTPIYTSGLGIVTPGRFHELVRLKITACGGCEFLGRWLKKTVAWCDGNGSGD